METETFKQQQQDRIDEGKDLKHEDELRDLSQIPSKELPGASNKSLLTKISQGISSVANTISEKVGLSEPVIEGHEELDKNVRKQVKKINQEILKNANEGKLPEVENQWEKSALPSHSKKVESTKNQAEGLVSQVSQKIDEVKDSGNLSSKTTIQPNRDGPSPLDKINEQYDAVATKVEQTVDQVTSSEPVKQTESTSIAGKIKQGVSGISESISQGVGNLKQIIGGQKAEEREDDGTKRFRTVNDGIKESVDDVKHEKRVEELGGQEELTSKNPFQPLTSGNNDQEGENRTLGEKVKGGLQDASQKISSTVGGVTSKVKSTFVHKEPTVQDKENTQQIA